MIAPAEAIAAVPVPDVFSVIEQKSAEPQSAAASGWSIGAGTTIGPVVIPPAKALPQQNFNFGLGNAGSFNFGSGNQGDWNFGNGNLGSVNFGSGNLGSNNFGFGNNGSGNLGGGNTGSGNFGFGNTGSGNIGFGLTGNNQIGFGGFNSGTGNTGLFNSGTGNTGFFNSGTGNWGFGNAGKHNTGSFNVGDASTGDANVGNLNTGSFNIGPSNSGNFNIGSTNSGDLNSGDNNTGWFNSGSANTGLFNSGYLNTGAFNSGNASNGLFETEDNKNWFPGIHVEYTIPGITIDETIPLDIAREIPVGPLTLKIGPTTSDVHVTGNTGPIIFTVLDIPAGPGFFNTGAVGSSGLFNTGAGGGSGLLNTGAGPVSGYFNQALQAVSGLSGYSNSGSGSGFSNRGSAVSGWRNTSSLDTMVLAFVSGFGNLGALLAGMYVNQPTGGTTFNLGAGSQGSLNIGDGNLGDNNLGAGNHGDGNVGFGNVGGANLGSGNVGNMNLGGGNAGSGNVGSGNLGDANVGWGNNGSGNFGGGNTGNGNIGFGNTGNGNIGIGLTGNDKFGIGGFNSGTGNKGLFNSGTGNTGFFNSGTKNWGFGNAGITNTGLFNTGQVNTGLGNSGDLNTGSHNAGSSNTGNANAGDANSGVANIGNTNTGWSNIGWSNTGWVNTGDLNTGAYNTGTGSNGLFWRRDAGGQLNIDLGADLSQVPVTLIADIPVNIPITAVSNGPLSIPSAELPAFTLDTGISQSIDLALGFKAKIDVAVAGSLGPVMFPGADVNLPEVVGTIGGPGVSIPVTVTGSIGPGRISLLRFGGPGLFNMTGAPTSGLFNSGAGGGSGFLNAGSGVSSGLLNEALLAMIALSGSSNSGSGSGSSNVGSAISGWSNTSSLDPSVPAFVSGLCNVGANLSGLFVNADWSGNGGPTIPEGSLAINLNAAISEIPIDVDANIGLDIPVSADLSGPITLKAFTIPSVPGNVDASIKLGVVDSNGDAVVGPVTLPLTPNLGIGPITVPDINVDAIGTPFISAQIGGPDVSIPIKITGAIGPTAGPVYGGVGVPPLFTFAAPGSGLNVNINVPHTPIKLNADVPVDIPVTVDVGALLLREFTIPGFDVTTSGWDTLHNVPVSSPLGDWYLDFGVPGTTLPVSDITVNSALIGLPTVDARIGGPGAGVGLNLDAGLGPFTVSAPIGLALTPTPTITIDTVNVNQIPLTGNLTVPVDLPINVIGAFPWIDIPSLAVRQFTVGAAPKDGLLQGLVLEGALKEELTPPVASLVLNNPCTLVCLAFQLSPTLDVGPFITGPISGNWLGLSTSIGGPGKGFAVDATGALGPIAISLENQVVEEFPYSYLVNVGTDLPVNGSFSALGVFNTSLSGDLTAGLNYRLGICGVSGAACDGMTFDEYLAYLNGGNPAGSALGPFPPNVPVDSVSFGTTLEKVFDQIILVPSSVFTQENKSDTTSSGSGTLGPFPLS